MPVTAVVGAAWGDEGKGKITDVLAAGAGAVARFQGGRNAGHTILNDLGRFALHLLPSGVFRPGVTNLLGPGVAVDPAALLEELDGLTAAGLPAPDLLISDRAQLVLPSHLLADRCEEERLGERAFGSTRAGMAPFYADKCLKVGVRAGDLFDPAWLRERIARSLEARNALFRHLYGREEMTVDSLCDHLSPMIERLRPMVGDTAALLRRRLDAGQRILAEGQLGALRDPDHGIYPYSTSSSTLAGFASVGLGVPPRSIDEIVAVAKAYSSCVGAGPFVTEWKGRGRPGTAAARRRPRRVRRHHRPGPAGRPFRRRGQPLRLPPPGRHLRGPDQPRRPRIPRGDPPVHGLPDRRRARPPTSRAPGTLNARSLCTRVCRAGAPTSPGPAAGGICPMPPAVTSIASKP